MWSTYISSVFFSGSPRNEAGPVTDSTAPSLTWARDSPAPIASKSAIRAPVFAYAGMNPSPRAFGVLLRPSVTWFASAMAVLAADATTTAVPHRRTRLSMLRAIQLPKPGAQKCLLQPWRARNPDGAFALMLRVGAWGSAAMRTGLAIIAIVAIAPITAAG